MTENDEFPGFKKCLEMVCSNDPMTFEDGYHLLLPKVREFSHQIVDALNETKNPKIESRLIELLGECENDAFIEVFEKYLSSESPEVISWALSSLDKLPKGVEVAKHFRAMNPGWED